MRLAYRWKRNFQEGRPIFAKEDCKAHQSHQLSVKINIGSLLLFAFWRKLDREGKSLNKTSKGLTDGEAYIEMQFLSKHLSTRTRFRQKPPKVHNNQTCEVVDKIDQKSHQ